MPRTKVDFPNARGERLAALLELPEAPARAFALFAHCFTCSKDVAAASRITRALAARGVATLRFDFTGLGNSDGDFANTNFSSNLEDLRAAARYLETAHRAPALLIGHSLGGAAVLAAAHAIPSARALVTIGAPATADHLRRLLGTAEDELSTAGEALITLGGRRFAIRRQLLDDLERWGSTDHIARLGKALLVCHAPGDAVVSIDEAARIYQAARHPKSFLSLDEADHLLSRREDSEYLAGVIAAWAARYLGAAAPAAASTPGLAPGTLRVSERDRHFARDVVTTRHRLVADEPESMGGTDTGPNPYEYLLAALGACTSMTVRMYANRKELPLDRVEVTLAHRRIHAEDCERCESETGFVAHIEKRIRLEGDLSSEQRTRLLEIADRCPVQQTLLNEILIDSIFE